MKELTTNRHIHWMHEATPNTALEKRPQKLAAARMQAHMYSHEASTCKMIAFFCSTLARILETCYVDVLGRVNTKCKFPCCVNRWTSRWGGLSYGAETGAGALFLCHRTNHLRGGTGGGRPHLRGGRVGGGRPPPSRPLTVVKGPGNRGEWQTTTPRQSVASFRDLLFHKWLYALTSHVIMQ